MNPYCIYSEKQGYLKCRGKSCFQIYLSYLFKFTQFKRLEIVKVNFREGRYFVPKLQLPKTKPLNHQPVKGFFVAPPGIEPGS